MNPAPIAYQVAQESHADPKPFMVGLAICISTSFCTPVVHETTMLRMPPEIMGASRRPFTALRRTNAVIVGTEGTIRFEGPFHLPGAFVVTSADGSQTLRYEERGVT